MNKLRHYQLVVGEMSIMIATLPEIEKVLLSLTGVEDEILLSNEQAYILGLQLIAVTSENK